MALVNGIDLPIQQQMAMMPYTYTYHGACMTDDGKRFIYWAPFYGQASFYRYDVLTDSWSRLANHPLATTTSGYGADLAFDASRQRIWAIGQGTTAFYYYDIQANVWSAALAVLPTTPYYPNQITHPCSHRGAASDDFVYYIGGDADVASQRLYRYTISTNTWAELGTNILSGACHGGCRLIWGGETEPDKIYIFRGNNTMHFWEYTISTNTLSYLQRMFGGANQIYIGSNSCYDHVTGTFYWSEYAERQINKTYLRTGALISGTATDGAAKSLTDSTKAWGVDDLAGSMAFTVTITGGTGVGQTRKIESNTATVLSVEPAWDVTPNATSTYEIKASVCDYSVATSGGASALNDTTKTWIANAWQYCKVKIVAGTGAGQERAISTNTATGLTVTPSWSVNPDATSKYEILGWKALPEAQVPYTTNGGYYGNTMAFMRIKGFSFVYHARRGGVQEFYRWLTVSP